MLHADYHHVHDQEHVEQQNIVLFSKSWCFGVCVGTGGVCVRVSV